MKALLEQGHRWSELSEKEVGQFRALEKSERETGRTIISAEHRELYYANPVEDLWPVNYQIWEAWMELSGSRGEGISLIDSIRQLLDEWGITNRSDRRRFRKLLIGMHNEQQAFIADKRPRPKRPKGENKPQT